MKINGRDVTLTSEELDLLKRLKDNDVMSIIKSDEDTFMWNDGDFSLKGSLINVRWFKGFDWMENDETISVQKLLDMSKKPKTVWDLENGDDYWQINAYGTIYECKWNNDGLEIKCRNQGNVFLTKEEAEFEAKRRKVVTKVRKYTRPFKFGEENWTPYWSFNRESIDWNSISGYIQEAQLYFENEEKIEQAIAEVGEEDFIKYFLKVRDYDIKNG